MMQSFVAETKGGRPKQLLLEVKDQPGNKRQQRRKRTGQFSCSLGLELAGIKPTAAETKEGAGQLELPWAGTGFDGANSSRDERKHVSSHCLECGLSVLPSFCLPACLPPPQVVCGFVLVCSFLYFCVSLDQSDFLSAGVFVHVVNFCSAGRNYPPRPVRETCVSP